MNDLYFSVHPDTNALTAANAANFLEAIVIGLI